MSTGQQETGRVYLDWAAATPLLPEAKVAMEPYLSGDFGNPGAIHREGQVAQKAVEQARNDIARSLVVRPEFVTFTSGGTEGNNMSIMGTIEALHRAGRAYEDMEVISTAIEHPSISRTMEHLGKLGVVVRYVEVDGKGFVKQVHLRTLLSPRTVLFSVAYANSEIGVVQSLHGLRKVLREAEEKFKTNIYFHVDAAQAPLWLSCQFEVTCADILTLDMGKCCGPKGVGVLVRSRRLHILPIIHGGGQEQGLRSGTENVAGIVGGAVALVHAQANWRVRGEQVRIVRDEGITLLLAAVPEAVLNGPTGEERLANNINLSIPHVDTEYAAVWLDSRGFAVSTKSACAGASGGESVVVKAISADATRARSTLRFTLGPETILTDLQKLAEVVGGYIMLMRNLTH